MPRNRPVPRSRDEPTSNSARKRRPTESDAAEREAKRKQTLKASEGLHLSGSATHRPFGLNPRSDQLEVAKEVARLVGAGHNVAEVNGDGGAGKTLTAGLMVKATHAELQKNARTKGTTVALCFSMRAAFEPAKAQQYGAATDTQFTVSNRVAKADLKTQIANNGGLGVVYCKLLAMISGFGGHKNGCGLADLKPDDFRDERKYKAKTRGGRLPGFLKMIDELGAKNFIIVVDEHQWALSQGNRNVVSLILNMHLLCRAPWRKNPVNVVVFGLTPNYDDKQGACSTSNFLQNIYEFYNLKPWPKGPPPTKVEAMAARVSVTLSNEQALAAVSWAKSGNTTHAQKNMRGVTCLENPLHPVVLKELSTAIVMDAASPNCYSSQEVKDKTYGLYQIASTKGGVNYKGSLPRDYKSKSYTGDETLTPLSNRTIINAFFVVRDAVSLVNGKITSDDGVCPHPYLKGKRLMQRVLATDASSGQPTKFKKIKHDELVCVVDDAPFCNVLLPLWSALYEAQNDDQCPSLIFDLTAGTIESALAMMQGTIRNEFLKNERRIFVFVRADQVCGAHAYNSVTWMVALTCSDAIRREIFCRLTRCVEVKPGDVVVNFDEQRLVSPQSELTHRYTAKQHGGEWGAMTSQPDCFVYGEILSRLKETFSSGDRDIVTKYKNGIFRGLGVKTPVVPLGRFLPGEPIASRFERLVNLRAGSGEEFEEWNTEFTNYLRWIYNKQSPPSVVVDEEADEDSDDEADENADTDEDEAADDEDDYEDADA